MCEDQLSPLCCGLINYMFGPSLQKLGRAIREAAGDGRTKEVIALLDQGADLEATDEV